MPPTTMPLGEGPRPGSPPRLLHLPRAAVSAVAWANGVAAAITGAAPLLGAGKVAELYHRDWVCRGNPLTEFSAWRPTTLAERGFPSTLAWYKGHKWL